MEAFELALMGAGSHKIQGDMCIYIVKEMLFMMAQSSASCRVALRLSPHKRRG